MNEQATRNSKICLIDFLPKLKMTLFVWERKICGQMLLNKKIIIYYWTEELLQWPNNWMHRVKKETQIQQKYWFYSFGFGCMLIPPWALFIVYYDTFNLVNMLRWTDDDMKRTFVRNLISEMMQILGLYRYFIIIGCLFFCVEFIQCHRSDVYIAGFFPYGLGKENSETGKFSCCSKA